MAISKTDGVNLGQAQLVRETDKAVLVELEDDDQSQRWIPKSQIHDDSEVFNKDNATGDLVVTRWFAEKESLA